jgi:hypothetical protein
MNAIKLSKPLIGLFPEKGSPKLKIYRVLYDDKKKRGV